VRAFLNQLTPLNVRLFRCFLFRSFPKGERLAGWVGWGCVVLFCFFFGGYFHQFPFCFRSPAWRDRCLGRNAVRLTLTLFSRYRPLLPPTLIRSGQSWARDPQKAVLGTLTFVALFFPSNPSFSPFCYKEHRLNSPGSLGQPHGLFFSILIEVLSDLFFFPYLSPVRSLGKAGRLISTKSKPVSRFF